MVILYTSDSEGMFVALNPQVKAQVNMPIMCLLDYVLFDLLLKEIILSVNFPCRIIAIKYTNIFPNELFPYSNDTNYNLFYDIHFRDI